MGRASSCVECRGNRNVDAGKEVYGYPVGRGCSYANNTIFNVFIKAVHLPTFNSIRFPDGAVP